MTHHSTFKLFCLSSSTRQKVINVTKKVSLSQRDEWWFKSIDDSSWLMILYWNTITDGLTNEGTDNGKSRVAFATQDHLRYLVLNWYFCQNEISRIVLECSGPNNFKAALKFDDVCTKIFSIKCIFCITYIIFSQNGQNCYKKDKCMIECQQYDNNMTAWQ